MWCQGFRGSGHVTLFVKPDAIVELLEVKVSFFPTLLYQRVRKRRGSGVFLVGSFSVFQGRGGRLQRSCVYLEQHFVRESYGHYFTLDIFTREWQFPCLDVGVGLGREVVLEVVIFLEDGTWQSGVPFQSPHPVLHQGHIFWVVLFLMVAKVFSYSVGDLISPLPRGSFWFPANAGAQTGEDIDQDRRALGGAPSEGVSRLLWHILYMKHSLNPSTVQIRLLLDICLSNRNPRWMLKQRPDKTGDGTC